MQTKRRRNSSRDKVINGCSLLWAESRQRKVTLWSTKEISRWLEMATRWVYWLNSTAYRWDRSSPLLPSAGRAGQIGSDWCCSHLDRSTPASLAGQPPGNGRGPKAYQATRRTWTDKRYHQIRLAVGTLRGRLPRSSSGSRHFLIWRRSYCG
jgi:hypothetical protein